jgi:hypothetical protein
LIDFSPSTIAALVIAASFAAGLNVYATMLALGLMARAHWIELPPGLDPLTRWWIVCFSGCLFGLEFVADKIPGLDLIWNGLQTFVRIPAAALMAYHASAQLTPQMQVIATIGGAIIAALSHSSKTAVRAAVTPSPEPFSNMSLSAGEDILVVFMMWLVTKHPWASASIGIAFMALALISARWLYLIIRKALNQPHRRQQSNLVRD